MHIIVLSRTAICVVGYIMYTRWDMCISGLVTNYLTFLLPLTRHMLRVNFVEMPDCKTRAMITFIILERITDWSIGCLRTIKAQCSVNELHKDSTVWQGRSPYWNDVYLTSSFPPISSDRYCPALLTLCTYSVKPFFVVAAAEHKLKPISHRESYQLTVAVECPIGGAIVAWRHDDVTDCACASTTYKCGAVRNV